MDQAFIDEMKQVLEEERDSLREQLDVVSDPDTGDQQPGERIPHFPDYGDDALDADDNSTAESIDYALNVEVTGTLEARLKEVEEALQRIEEGTYGVAADGTAIHQDRLRANPAATENVQ